MKFTCCECAGAVNYKGLLLSCWHVFCEQHRPAAVEQADASGYAAGLFVCGQAPCNGEARRQLSSKVLAVNCEELMKKYECECCGGQSMSFAVSKCQTCGLLCAPCHTSHRNMRIFNNTQHQLGNLKAATQQEQMLLDDLSPDCVRHRLIRSQVLIKDDVVTMVCKQCDVSEGQVFNVQDYKAALLKRIFESRAGCATLQPMDESTATSHLTVQIEHTKKLIGEMQKKMKSAIDRVAVELTKRVQGMNCEKVMSTQQSTYNHLKNLLNQLDDVCVMVNRNDTLLDAWSSLIEQVDDCVRSFAVTSDSKTPMPLIDIKKEMLSGISANVDDSSKPISAVTSRTPTATVTPVKSNSKKRTAPSPASQTPKQSRIGAASPMNTTGQSTAAENDDDEDEEESDDEVEPCCMCDSLETNQEIGRLEQCTKCSQWFHYKHHIPHIAPRIGSKFVCSYCVKPKAAEAKRVEAEQKLMKLLKEDKEVFKSAGARILNLGAQPTKFGKLQPVDMHKILTLVQGMCDEMDLPPNVRQKLTAYVNSVDIA